MTIPEGNPSGRMHGRFVLTELCKDLGIDHLLVKRVTIHVDVQDAVQVDVTYFPRGSEFPLQCVTGKPSSE